MEDELDSTLQLTESQGLVMFIYLNPSTEETPQLKLNHNLLLLHVNKSEKGFIML